MEKEIQVVGFRIGNETFGVRISLVREIVRLPEITAVPNAPDDIEGVINLRGKIIPVMDMRVRFNFTAENTDQTCIVVVQVKTAEGKVTQMGLIVDGVEEVINIGDGDIEPAPDFGGQISMEYITGIAKVKGLVKSLLNIDAVIGGASNNAALAMF